MKTNMIQLPKNYQPHINTPQSGGLVINLWGSEFSSIQETLYLLSLERNADRLRASIAQIKSAR